MSIREAVLVYGAAGHTGRFVVSELLRRGLSPVAAGRSSRRVGDFARGAGLEHRAFEVDDARELARGLDGIQVVINCAGPFLDTALPLASAAIDAGVHYLDVAAEQSAVHQVYDTLDVRARRAGVAVVPAMAFYGGLADLLLSAALGNGTEAQEVIIAIGLDHWWPTDGTRATGARNTAVRHVIRGGALVPLNDPAPTADWCFSDQHGAQPVVEVPFSETVLIHRHLRIDHLRSYLNLAPLMDLRNPQTPPPPAAGRSPQRFVVDIDVRQGSDAHRISVSGRDIYATTAPIVVEGAVRLLDGRYHATGALAPAQAFDPGSVIATLAEQVEDLKMRVGTRNV